MPRRSLEINPGDEMTGLRVLQVLGDVGDLQRFEIRWLCCGRLDEITRPALRKRISSSSLRCGRCARIETFRKIGAANKKHELPREARQPTGEGVMDLGGQWWPKLGKKGARWEQSGGTNSRIGTGR